MTIIIPLGQEADKVKSKPSQTPLNKAHTGLLRVAENMLPKIEQLIHKYLGDPTGRDNGTVPKAKIIFTGHSAGGGVAALLYLHYRLSDAAFNSTLLAPPQTSGLTTDENYN
jgi:alpha-beta hydrolase superfamily lysophospholipase